MSSEHFDAKVVSDSRSPDGFEKILGDCTVLVDRNVGRVVLTGMPADHHNCDRRGCGTLEHKIAEFDVDKSVFEPARLNTADKEEEQ